MPVTGRADSDARLFMIIYRCSKDVVDVVQMTNKKDARLGEILIRQKSCRIQSTKVIAAQSSYRIISVSQVWVTKTSKARLITGEFETHIVFRLLIHPGPYT